MEHRTKIRSGARLALVLGCGAALAGCSLDADGAAGITEPDLQTPEAVRALVNGVVGDYDAAHTGSVLFSGLLSDELRASGPWAGWHKADREGVIDVQLQGGGIANFTHEWWGRLQRARVLAEDTYDRIGQVMPGSQAAALQATTRLYSGLAYRDLGEFFCAAAYDGGPRVERAQSLELARSHLDEAVQLAGAAGVDSVAHLARLARARVHLSLGELDQALTDAAAVPGGFRWVSHYGGTEVNELFLYANEQSVATVQEPFWRTGDPRVVVANTGAFGLDGLTPRWDQKKYDSRAADIPLGTWQEARLIEAEVLLEQGRVADAVQRMDEVRAAAGLPPLGAPDAAGAREALRSERKHQLFLEGHRMLDQRRWGLNPEGWGSACVPLPLSETNNNPNV